MPDKDEIFYSYEKYDENMKPQLCPANDYDGAITGHYVMSIRLWFDENPEERKRLGWIKHLQPTPKQAGVEYNPQTQNINLSQRMIDEYTMEDIYFVTEKSEEQMLLEEMLESMNLYVPTGKVVLDDHGGVIV